MKIDDDMQIWIISAKSQKLLKNQQKNNNAIGK